MVPHAIYILEMTSPEELVAPTVEATLSLQLEEVGPSETALVRRTYQRIGAPLNWGGRMEWPDSQWADEMVRAEVQMWIALINHEAAGLLEIEAMPDGRVGIVVFGLVPEIQGKGAGGAFLASATRLAWAMPRPDGSTVSSVIVQTSSRDHPHALNNYRARGFRVIETLTVDAPTIRPAALSDAHQIANVHVNAWRWAYKGQVPDAYLEALSVADRTSAFSSLLTDEDETRLWVAVSDDEIVGFVSAGPSRDKDSAKGTGEVYAIYLEQAYVRTGLGRRLFQTATQWLGEEGCDVVTAWVLTSNDLARRFYESAGLSPDGTTKVEPRESFAFHEIRYRGAISGS